ncbi:DUF397 domain-containing protein [Streptomyces albireticuli]|uniref:DUF397 domain-containing protein n=1 Tax=Streptomyces albireticuli TaxID=1940 RepID=UPI0036AA5EF3
MDWQKSSFCGGGGNNCVELRPESGLIRMRESTDPGTAITLTRDQLTTFVTGVKAGTFEHLI